MAVVDGVKIADRSHLKSDKTIVFRDETFADFKKTLEDAFSTGAFTIMYIVGKGCGIRSYSRLEQIWHSISASKSILKLLAEHKMSERWGDFRFELTADGTGKVRIRECFEARGYGSSDSPVCYFVKGFLEGFLSKVFCRPINVTEVSCLAKGDSECIFMVKPE